MAACAHLNPQIFMKSPVTLIGCPTPRSCAPCRAVVLSQPSPSRLSTNHKQAGHQTDHQPSILILLMAHFRKRASGELLIATNWLDWTTHHPLKRSCNMTQLVPVQHSGIWMRHQIDVMTTHGPRHQQSIAPEKRHWNSTARHPIDPIIQTWTPNGHIRNTLAHWASRTAVHGQERGHGWWPQCDFLVDQFCWGGESQVTTVVWTPTFQLFPWQWLSIVEIEKRGINGIHHGLVVHLVVRLNEWVAVVSVDRNTHLKVGVLKHLDNHYMSFWTKYEAIFQKLIVWK